MFPSDRPLPFPLEAPRLNRRGFLGASTSLVAALAAGRVLASSDRVVQNPSFVAYPFQLGVASGDPSEDGFVIWTRLAPQPLAGGGMPDVAVRVRWEVAEDEGMKSVVARGEQVATPDWGHSVHVEVTGLQPDRWYWYRFMAGAETTVTGRTRTLAGVGRSAAEVSPLKIAFASCQHFEAGFYTAYEHMLAESPDLVLHLGDYIYEGRSREGQIRLHHGDEIMDLTDYRNRHAQYKTDPALQAMHAAAPWLVTWDDHEFDNNCAADIPEEKGFMERDAFLRRRAAAYQAYYEHMPLRAACIPKGPDMTLHRTVRHGRLADFHVLDTRQYRTDQPNGDGSRRPGRAVMSPGATMLGPAQRGWLTGELANASATWSVLAQQVMMARVDRAAGEKVRCSMDQWPGYEVERRALLDTFLAMKTSNPVVLTGDIHTHWANELPVRPDQPDAPIAGTEFVCTSISSKGDGNAKPAELESLMSENPFVKHYGDLRGYVSCRIDAKQWQADFRAVPHVTRPGAPLITEASFVVENGRRELQRA